MRSIRILVTAACCALQPSLVAGQEAARFELFADCGPIGLAVGNLSEDAAEIGLTESSIRDAAESRLRSARLYSEASDQYLYVNVTVVGHAFAVNLRYKKRVLDPLSGLGGFATTWNSGGTGTHGRDPGFILSGVSQHLDRFLVEFLRVNEASCGKR